MQVTDITKNTEMTRYAAALCVSQIQMPAFQTYSKKSEIMLLLPITSS